MATYGDLLDAIERYYGYESDQWYQIAKYGIHSANAYNILKSVPGVDLVINSDGSIRDWTYTDVLGYGDYSNIGSNLNSNTISSIVNSSVKTKIPATITGTSTTGNFEISSGIGLSASSGTTVSGVLSTVGVALGAVGLGAKFGKKIASALYNLNPDYWDYLDMSTLNPDTWRNIIDKDSTVQNALFTALFGVDGNSTTMYLDENAVAYLAYWMQKNNFFTSEATADLPDYSQANGVTIDNIIPLSTVYKYCTEKAGKSISFFTEEQENKFNSFFTKYADNAGRVECYAGTNEVHGTYGALTLVAYNQKAGDTFPKSGNIYQHIQDTYSTTYPLEIHVSNVPNESGYSTNVLNIYQGESINSSGDYVVSNFNGTITFPLDGVTDVADETRPDLSGVGSVSAALGALKEQYPDWWNDAVEKDVPQEDGSSKKYTYIPVPIPSFTTANDKQATTDDSSNQKDPSVDPDKTPENLLEKIAQILGQDPTKNDDPNTGDGDTPTIVTPSQQASSLWAIYNPSLSELNSLGAWLWSTDFIDQLLKIFNDPMQAIIGLHKIYASPVISGSGTIKVGYLDSGVSSNIVGNQYTYIDCGSVSLREYYGNVLDYSPYTTVQLYLPFIGIVSLDIADVSRSTISVKYGVDVLTGACLASVSVQRDNAGGVLYQYSGNCACQYPLSSGSYMGMVTGMIGAVGSLARGNIFGTAMSVAGMHTNIEHSGGFSGNVGAMGAKKPYLIISRPQSAMNDGFPSIQGYPSNYYTRLGNCSGFTQIAECHVENIPATDKELDKIKDLLKEGVIL